MSTIKIIEYRNIYLSIYLSIYTLYKQRKKEKGTDRHLILLCVCMCVRDKQQICFADICRCIYSIAFSSQSINTNKIIINRFVLRCFCLPASCRFFFALFFIIQPRLISVCVRERERENDIFFFILFHLQ